MTGTERWLRVENAGTGEIAEYRNGTRRVVRPRLLQDPTQASASVAGEIADGPRPTGGGSAACQRSR